MRKILPVAIFGLIFSSVLIMHAVFDKETSTFAESTANLGVKSLASTQSKKLEAAFAKAQWVTDTGVFVVPSKIQAKVIIVNFWASWCQPCLEEMPSLAKLKKKYSDQDLQVIAVNTDEDDQMKSLKKALKKLNIRNEFIHALDQKGKVSDAFEISAIPVTMVFSNGKLLEYNNGPVDFSSGEFSSKVEKWLKK